MKKRILVVDDEPAITRMVKLNLERTKKYEVRTENQGSKAIEAARDFEPHLIFLDVMMPDFRFNEFKMGTPADPEGSPASDEFSTML